MQKQTSTVIFFLIVVRHFVLLRPPRFDSQTRLVDRSNDFIRRSRVVIGRWACGCCCGLCRRSGRFWFHELLVDDAEFDGFADVHEQIVFLLVAVFNRILPHPRLWKSQNKLMNFNLIVLVLPVPLPQTSTDAAARLSVWKYRRRSPKSRKFLHACSFWSFPTANFQSLVGRRCTWRWHLCAMILKWNEMKIKLAKLKILRDFLTVDGQDWRVLEAHNFSEADHQTD